MSRVTRAVVGVTLLVAGCGGEVDSSTDSGCFTSSACAAGQVCEQGVCVEASTPPDAAVEPDTTTTSDGGVTAGDGSTGPSGSDATGAKDVSGVDDGTSVPDSVDPQDIADTTPDSELPPVEEVEPADAPPSASITSPLDADEIAYGEPVALVGSVTDDLDAPDTLTAVWTSDLQGVLGESAVDSDGSTTLSVDAFLPGTHLVTLSVTDSAEQTGEDSVSFLVNTAPGAPEISISPADPTTLDDLVVLMDTPALDPDRGATDITYTIAWLKGGEAVEDLDSDDVPASATARGETWVAVVTPWDGLNEGAPATAEVTILNTAPTCTTAELTPAQGETATVFSCACSDRVDPDDDAPVDTCVFSSSDGVIDEEVTAVDGVCQLDPLLTAKDMTLSCDYTAGDGDAEGEVAASESAEVLNTPPSPPTIAVDPPEGTVTTAYSCLLVTFAEDADDDAVTYVRQWYVNDYPSDGATGTLVVADSLVSDNAGTPASAGDTLRCEVMADDGTHFSITAVSQDVVLANTAPAGGQAVVMPAEPTEASTLTCQVTGGGDADGDEVTWEITWYVDETPVPAAADGTLEGSDFAKHQSVYCTATPSDGTTTGEVVQSSNTVVIANTGPPEPVVSLSPTEGAVGTTFTCAVTSGGEDIDGDTSTFEWAWLVNDHINTAVSTATVLAADLDSDDAGTGARGGDSVSCQAWAHDGEVASSTVDSAAVVLENSAPTGGTVSVSPTEATTTQDLVCEATGAVDPDGDEIVWSYVWFVDDDLVIGEVTETLASTHFSKGDNVYCAATPTDGQAQGSASMSTNEVFIANTAPPAPEIAVNPPAGAVTQSYTCSVSVPAVDLDGDLLTYTATWLVNGIETAGVLDTPVEASELVASEAGELASGGDMLQCQVVANDGTADSVPVVSPGIVFGNASPVGGSVTISPIEAREADVLTCEATGAVDPDGEDVFWFYTWSRNGELIDAVTTATIDGNHFDKGDVITCSATPTDGSTEGAAVQSDVTVNILNSVPSAPFVALVPQAGGVLDTFTCEVQVEATDDDPGDSLDHVVNWVVNGYENADAHEVTRAAVGLYSDAEQTPIRGSDTLTCIVRADDGMAIGPAGESNAVALDNTPPQGGQVGVEPAEATEEDTLSCVASGAVDPDAQPVTWTFVWLVNGELVPGQTDVQLSADYFGTGDSITCTATPTDGADSGVAVPAENTVAVANTLPSMPTIGVSPEAGQVVTDFTCEVVAPSIDPDGDTLTYEKRWIVNGFVNDVWQDVAKPLNLFSDAEGTKASGGDSLSCQARAHDGYGFSEMAQSPPVVLANTPPSGGAVWINPPAAAEGAMLSCDAAGASDADGDEITWSYTWYASDEVIVGQTDATLTSDHFGSGDIVRCAAVASDGEDDGPPLQSENAVQVGNTLPTAPEIELDPEAGTVETSFTCTVTVAAGDSDGDELTYITHWVVNGYENVQLDAATVTPLELLSDALGTKVRGGDTLSCRVRASDGVGLSESAESTVVTLDNTPPTGGVVALAPEIVKEGSTLHCNPSGATDVDGDIVLWTFAWTVNGEVVADASADTLTSEYFDKHQTVSCSATPTDGEDAGASVASGNAVVVQNTPPLVAPPIISPLESNRLGTFSCEVNGWQDPDPADVAEAMTYQWVQAVDDGHVPIPGAEVAELPAASLSPGDKVACRVTPFDADDNGTTVMSAFATVINSPPTLEAVALSPGFAFSNSTMLCSPVGGEDIDDDELTYVTEWVINEVPLADETGSTLAGAFDKGDTVRCVVTPHDGVAYGLAVPSNVVTIGNTLPVLSSVSVTPTSARLCESFSCTPGAVEDPDPSDQGGTDFFYHWTINDVPVGSGTPTLAVPDATPGDRVICHVAPWDGAVNGALQPETGAEVSSNEAVFVNPAPTVFAVSLEPEAVVRGDMLTCAHSGYSDDCNVPGIFTYRWLTLDPVTLLEGELAETGSTLDTSVVEPGLQVHCVLTASDGFANADFNSSNSVIVNNGAPLAGTVNVEAPNGADGDVICNSVVDAEDDEVLTIKYLWRIGSDSEFEGGLYLPAAQVKHCDRVRCRRQVSDNELTVTTPTSELILPLGSGSDCDDGNTCTAATCGAEGGCVQEHADGFCDDSQPCTQDDACVDQVCVGSPYDCDDEDVCTDDVCNGDGSCSHPFNTAPCDDLTPCTIGDTCSGGICESTVVDCSIYDTGCFEGVCTGPCEEGDACACIGPSCASCELVPAEGKACDDADECTLNDVCSDTGSCAGEWDKFGCGCVDDATCEADPVYNDACHVGRCDLDIFKCYSEQRPDGYACDDADLCTHTDECLAGACTTTPYDCDDDNLCTDDSCNGDGTCTNDANTVSCDDEDACTTDDVCHNKVCIGGAPVTCDDDAYCNGLETCDAAVGCVDGTPPALEDGVACTVDTCDEATNAVVHTPTDGLCDTATLCVQDTCHPTEGCQQEELTDCCGNGILEDGEVCDDGNADAGDGCSPTCTCECALIQQELCLESTGPAPPPEGGYDPTLAMLGPNGQVATSQVAGDVDNDGDMDILIGYEAASTLLFLNDGAGSYGAGLVLPRPVGNTSPTRALVLGDLDNDGDLDLVIGYDGDTDRQVMNDGSSSPFTSSEGLALNTGNDVTNSVTNTTSMALGDPEPDGDLDLIVGHSGQANHYLLNTGGTFSIGNVFDSSTSDTRDVAFVNYNLDGHLDIVVANFGAANKIVPWDAVYGLKYNYLFAVNLGVGVGGGAIEDDSQALLVADFNRDGYEDVAVANGVGDPDYVFFHNGTAFGLFGVPGWAIGDSATDTRDLVLFDRDRNAAPDLVRALNGSNDMVSNNSGALSYKDVAPITLDPEGYGYDTRGLLAFDADRDGAVDIVTANATVPSPVYATLHLAPLDGVIDRDLPGDLTDTVAIVAGDVSRSGSVDVIVAQGSGGLFLLPKNQTGAPFLGLPSVAIDGSDEAPSALALADVNHDGYIDLIVGNVGKVNRVYINNRTYPTFLAEDDRVDAGTSADSTQSVTTGDFDNDGDIDFAVANKLSSNKLYINDGGADPFAATAIEITTDTDESYAIAAGDLNGDGKLDLVVANDGAPSQFIMGAAGATPFSDTAAHDLEGSGGNSRAVAIGDVNGDGKLDVVLAQVNGLHLLYLNDGFAVPFSGVAPIAVGSELDDTRGLVLSDVDMDGDLDLVVGNFGRPNRVFMNNGTADPFTGVTPINVTDDEDGTIGLAIDTVDPDATPDLIAANNGSLSQFYRNRWLIGDLPSGLCVAECPAVPLVCDDGKFCNGTETCRGDHICEDGPAPNDPDSLDCTLDTCDEDLDTFVHTADDSLCDTSNLCMESVCSIDLGGCVEQPLSPCCGDGNLDGGESCDDENALDNDGCTATCECECHITGPFACLADDVVIPFDSAAAKLVAETDVASTDAAAGDVDGDGDIDVVVATAGSNLLYLNSGDGVHYTNVAPTAIGTDTDNTRALALADFDGDGDLDLVVGNVDAPIRYYWNNGSLVPFENVEALDIETGATEALAVADVNGDGLLDLLIGNKDTPDRVHLNNGTSTPFNAETGANLSQGSYYTTTLAVADVDGDGDVDVVAGHVGQNMLYLNGGGDTGLNGLLGTPLEDDFGVTEALAFVDADKDGDLDLLVANDPEGVLYWENTPTSPPLGEVASVLVVDGAFGVRDLAIEDFDGDGSLDFLAAFYEARPLVFYGDGSSAPFVGAATEEVGDIAPQTATALVVDIEGDGAPDVLLASADQPLAAIYNTAARATTGNLDPDIPNTIGDSRAIAAGDMDLDGDVDLVMAYRNAPNTFITNNHTVAPFAGAGPVNITVDGDDTRAIAVGDVDGDGWPDVVAGNRNQANRLYLSGGGPAPFAATVGTDITGDADDTRGLALGDLDGDGDLDLFVCNHGDPDRVVLNNGTADPFTGVSSTALGDDTIDSWAAAIHDLNGDGHADIAVANHDSGGTNLFYKGNGDGTFTVHELGTDGETSSSIALGDINGDGAIDVVIGNQNQVNRVYINDASTLPFGEISGRSITSDTHGTRGIAVGDLDQDGDLDVFAANTNQVLRVYLNDGTTVAFDDDAEGANIYDIELTAYGAVMAHLDRDGRIDAAIVNKDGLSVWISNHIIRGTADLEGCTGSCAPQPVDCDDDNTCSTDRCSVDGGCDFTDMAVDCCGNGITESGEACDDGNQQDGDACTSTCTTP